jgi:hypothetical protein
VVEHLFCMHQALDSILTNAKQTNNNNKRNPLKGTLQETTRPRGSDSAGLGWGLGDTHTDG